MLPRKVFLARQNQAFCMLLAFSFYLFIGSTSLTSGDMGTTEASYHDPESVIRLLVEANANKDLGTMKSYMGVGGYMVGYTIGGRKYTNWDDFAAVMQEEFDSVVRLTIPITALQVWQNGPIAWFAMELDYIREIPTSQGVTKTLIPLRETGVLEQRDGKWLLLHWHESMQNLAIMSKSGDPHPSNSSTSVNQSSKGTKSVFNASGFWEIQEEDKNYIATLDAEGNGPYTWKGGRLQTSEVRGRLWSGHWAQTGNDREGSFEVLLSEDFLSAEGVWWYTRVEDRKNIPPRMHGGTYLFKRLTPDEAKQAMGLAKEKEAVP